MLGLEVYVTIGTLNLDVGLHYTIYIPSLWAIAMVSPPFQPQTWKIRPFWLLWDRTMEWSVHPSRYG